MTEKQNKTLKNIGKVAVYTVLTAGAYLLTRGALSVVFLLFEGKDANKKETKKNA